MFTKTALAITTLLFVVIFSSACQPWVKPYQRAKLADEIMSFDRDPVSDSYMHHVRGAREGARGQKALAGVAVAATRSFRLALLALANLICSYTSFAAVLPEERADMMWHRYDGGGMVIDGPSYLVRKNITDKVSIAGNYYVDTVSSASIDVMTIKGASTYSEERTEYSVDTSYLADKTQINVGYTNSSENDYEATNARIDVSHAFFSEMTTVSMGFSRGSDDITRTNDADFSASLERRNYRFGASQILNKSLLLNLNYESIVDEGYLQNPYRKIIQTTCSVSVGLDGNSPVESLENCPFSSRVASLEDENYPRTRNSDAFSMKLSWHLPWSAAAKLKIGYFNDSWGIDGTSISLDYTHRFNRNFVADFRVRAYDQGNADFYANHHFVGGSTQTRFKGRDKELSEHSSLSFGAGVSYRFDLRGWFDSVELNAQVDYFQFDYDDFREYREQVNATTDVLGADFYEFDAYALRLFTTIRY